MTDGSRSIEIRVMERKGTEEMITDANRVARNRHNVGTKTENSDTKRHQTPRHTGRDCVKVRNYRAAAVCLVLLCVLLLTAVIVLGVNLHNIIEEFYIKNKNLTDEIKKLKSKKNRKYNLDYNITELSDENKKLKEMMTELWQQMDGWVCYQSSLYYVSSEKKNWTESKRDCTERGADLIILNNKQEQDFLKTFPGRSEVWIGVTDSVEEGRWKWVDGSTLSPGFWTSGEPSDSSGNEDCVVNLSSGVADYSCDKTFKWICKKNILKQ